MWDFDSSNRDGVKNLVCRYAPLKPIVNLRLSFSNTNDEEIKIEFYAAEVNTVSSIYLNILNLASLNKLTNLDIQKIHDNSMCIRIPISTDLVLFNLICNKLEDKLPGFAEIREELTRIMPINRNLIQRTVAAQQVESNRRFESRAENTMDSIVFVTARTSELRLREELNFPAPVYLNMSAMAQQFSDEEDDDEEYEDEDEYDDEVANRIINAVNRPAERSGNENESSEEDDEEEDENLEEDLEENNEENGEEYDEEENIDTYVVRDAESSHNVDDNVAEYAETIDSNLLAILPSFAQPPTSPLLLSSSSDQHSQIQPRTSTPPLFIPMISGHALDLIRRSNLATSFRRSPPPLRLESSITPGQRMSLSHHYYTDEENLAVQQFYNLLLDRRDILISNGNVVRNDFGKFCVSEYLFNILRDANRKILHEDLNLARDTFDLLTTIRALEPGGSHSHNRDMHQTKIIGYGMRNMVALMWHAAVAARNNPELFAIGASFNDAVNALICGIANGARGKNRNEDNENDNLSYNDLQTCDMGRYNSLLLEFTGIFPQINIVYSCLDLMLLEFKREIIFILINFEPGYVAARNLLLAWNGNIAPLPRSEDFKDLVISRYQDLRDNFLDNVCAHDPRLKTKVSEDLRKDEAKMNASALGFHLIEQVTLSEEDLKEYLPPHACVVSEFESETEVALEDEHESDSSSSNLASGGFKRLKIDP